MTAAGIIKKVRLSLGLSKSEFADLLNIHRSAMSNYEAGKRFPKMAIIRDIVDLAKKNKVKIKYEDFFTEED